jgi:hypothetical protein
MEEQLTVSAIERSVEDVGPKRPPFPFYQGGIRMPSRLPAGNKKRGQDDDDNYIDAKGQ